MAATRHIAAMTLLPAAPLLMAAIARSMCLHQLHTAPSDAPACQFGPLLQLPAAHIAHGILAGALYTLALWIPVLLLLASLHTQWRGRRCFHFTVGPERWRLAQRSSAAWFRRADDAQQGSTPALIGAKVRC